MHYRIYLTFLIPFSSIFLFSTHLTGHTGIRSINYVVLGGLMELICVVLGLKSESDFRRRCGIILVKMENCSESLF